MGVALQVRSGRLALLVSRALEHRMLTTCVPPSGGRYLDHLQPLPDLAGWEGGAGVATLRLPVDVYTVLRTDLLAHPDEVPAGAVTPTTRATLVLEMGVSGSSVTFAITDIPGLPEDLQAAVAGIVGAPPPIDLGPVLAALGLEAGTGGQVGLVGDLVVARLGDADGSAVPSVAVTHGFDWALFVDGATVAKSVEERIPSSLPPLQSVRTEATWRPDGLTMVRASIRGPMEVPPPAILEVTVDLGCHLSMPPGTEDLRIDVGYSLDFWTGVLAYEPSVALAVEAAETLAREKVDPAAFGGVRTSESSFAITRTLPRIEVAGERWTYEGMKAADAGLVIGGRVNVPTDLSAVRLHSQGIGFSGGNFLGLYCSKDDQPSEVARKGQVSTVAEVSYERAGRLCGVEVLPAGLGLQELLTLPGAAPLSGGVRPGDGRIFLALDVDTANLIQERVLIIVHTARGVRCHDVGRPEQFTVKEDGTIDGITVIYFEDCNTLPHNFDDMTPEQYDRWSGMIWYTYFGLEPGRDYDPDNPPIIPDTLEEIATLWDEISAPQAATEYDVTLTQTPPDEVVVTDADTMAVAPPGDDGNLHRATEEGSTVAELQEITGVDSDHG